MTFTEVALRMFRANLRRYALFFLCGAFAVMVFFIYATIYANPKLMAAAGSAPTTLYAPTLAVVLFSSLFTTYSYDTYARYRMKELGVFMTLGMTRAQTTRIVLVETGLIFSASVTAGLAGGTLLAGLLHRLVTRLLGITGVPFVLVPGSYLYTLLFSALVCCVAALSAVIATRRLQVVELLRRYRREARNALARPGFAIAGLVLIAVSGLDLRFSPRVDNSPALLRSSLTCLAGLYLAISNLAWFLSRANTLIPANRHRNLLFLANLKHSLGQTRNVIFAVSFLMAVAVFFANVCAFLLSDADRIAAGYNPYDIAYAEIGDREMPEGALDRIVNEAEARLVSKATLGFVKTSGLVILSDADVNALMGTSYAVEAGRFISLAQIMLDDNYPHGDLALYHLKSIEVQGRHYVSQGVVTKVLFNKVDLVAAGGARYIIVNHDDYAGIRVTGTAVQGVGRITLLRFADWRRTGGISDALAAELAQRSLGPPSSRIVTFHQLRQAANLTLFLFSFVAILFLTASPIMLHLKLLTDLEQEKVKYRKLFKVGITGQEVTGLARKELRVLFFLPCTLGTLLGLGLAYSLPAIVGDRALLVRYSLLIAGVCLLFQLCSYLLYGTAYVRSLLAGIRGIACQPSVAPVSPRE